MENAVDARIQAYLNDVARLLDDYPGPERAAFLSDLSEHIEAALQAHHGDLAAVLSGLGTPAEVADSFAENHGDTRCATTAVASPMHARRQELTTLTVLLLTIGGFVGFTINGWMKLIWLAGLTLLWVFPFWTLRSKLIATFALPAAWLTITELRVVQWVSTQQCDANDHCRYSAPWFMLVLGWILIVAAFAAIIWSIVQLFTERSIVKAGPRD